MRLLLKLQRVLLERHIKKGKSPIELAELYPMSLLVEKGCFSRYKNTELFCPTDINQLFSISGEFIGEPFCFADDETSEYIIVKNDNAKYNGMELKSTFAVYDKSGKCVVPHACYPLCYRAEDYAILTMPMVSEYPSEKITRVVGKNDDETTISSTGISLKETLGGSLEHPRAIVVSKNKVVNTKYSAVEPINVEAYRTQNVQENNIIWMGQTENEEEISFKLDKRLHITETYRFPLYTNDYEFFFANAETKAVYFIKPENKARINLRTGEQVSLLNLKRTRLSKEERLSDPTVSVEESGVVVPLEETVVEAEPIAEESAVEEVETVSTVDETTTD